VSTYVLVHGSWHGAWCWEKVVPLLEQAGHNVVAPDLPGLGQDQTPPGDVTLDSWTDFLCDMLDEQDEPVMLVGHSRGGLNITQAAERRPDGIKRLVYLCAFLPRDGESVLGLISSEPDNQILPNLLPSDDATAASFRKDALAEVFFNDCSDEDVEWAVSKVTPEPLAPASSPVATSDANFGRVPRSYIECLQDHAVPPALQKRMYEASPCDPVITMNSSHSPFISQPAELAGHLLSLA
jgi:pimeloyl-ACP methyl ester carboxylesterase